MPKAKEDKDLQQKELSEPEVKETRKVHVPKILVQAPKEKVYSFEQWAKLKGKPERHLGGMRAFLGSRANSKFPMAKWDEIFKSY